MAAPSAWNSTIVRAKVTAARTGFRIAEHVAPSLGGRYASRLWFTVPPAPRVPPPPVGGEPFELRIGGGAVRGESHGSGPVVYLMHGWGGVGRQLSAFVEPLRRSGHRVVLFDAPSHGRSDPGACGPGRTHGLEFAAALSAVGARFGPAHAVIAHSMGALPTLMAHRDGLPVGRFVLLAPMRDLNTHLDRFTAHLGMGRRTRLAFTDRTAHIVRHPLADFDVRRLAGEAEPVGLLVVHDRGDRETWHGHAVELVESWAGPATMISTRGLGHRRLLTDPHVVRQVVDFVGVAADQSVRAGA